MPQTDTDPIILEDRCYEAAAHYLAMNYGGDDYLHRQCDRHLGTIYEEVRSYLLNEFPDIEGPEIADLMREAMTNAGFPLWRVS